MSHKLAFATFVSVMVMAAFALCGSPAAAGQKWGPAAAGQKWGPAAAGQNWGPAAAGQNWGPAGIAALPGFGTPGLPSVQFTR